MLTRRLALAAPALLLPGIARAQAAWPSRSIRLVVPFAAGGAADSAARVLTPRMGEKLGQGFVVENRTGAGGSLGGAEVARATDGHSFLWDASSHIVNPSLLRGLPFDYATAFAPISLVVNFPSAVAVKNDFPARTLQEFVAQAKARRGAVTVGTQGNATAGHLGLAAFSKVAGIEVVHVPYRGGAAAAQDLASGAIDAVFTTLVSAGPVVDGGRARFLGVGTLTRVESRPDIPTIAESGFPGLNPMNGRRCSARPARHPPWSTRCTRRWPRPSRCRRSASAWCRSAACRWPAPRPTSPASSPRAAQRWPPWCARRTSARSDPPSRAVAGEGRGGGMT